MAQQQFGDFVEVTDDDQQYLQLGFSPSLIPLQQRWRNNGLSADFLADYLSSFFPGDDDKTLNRRAEMKDSISYVANELLENAMKYHYAPSGYSISINMRLGTDRIRLYLTNSVDPTAVDEFQGFVQNLLTHDPNDLYIEQLMRNEDDEGRNADEASGLGFLTMLNDYGAQLAWKFDTQENGGGVTTVTTLVTLPLSMMTSDNTQAGD